MKTLLLAFVAASFMGCAHRIGPAVLSFQNGDSLEDVKSVLGEPVAFMPWDGGMAYTFRGGGDLCSLVFKEDKLTARACGNDPKHVSVGRAIGAFSKGMSDGMRQ